MRIGCILVAACCLVRIDASSESHLKRRTLTQRVRDAKSGMLDYDGMGAVEIVQDLFGMVSQTTTVEDAIRDCSVVDQMMLEVTGTPIATRLFQLSMIPGAEHDGHREALGRLTAAHDEALTALIGAPDIIERLTTANDILREAVKKDLKGRVRARASEAFAISETLIRRIDGFKTFAMDPRGLRNLKGWEEFDSVRLLRKVWTNIKDSLIPDEASSELESKAVGRYESRNTRSITLEEALDALAVMAKGLLGVEMWLDPVAHREHDLAFTVVVSKGGEIRGRVHLEAGADLNLAGEGIVQPFTRDGSIGASYIDLAGVQVKPADGSIAGVKPKGSSVKSKGSRLGLGEKAESETRNPIDSNPFVVSDQRQSLRSHQISEPSFAALASSMAQSLGAFLNEWEFVGAIESEGLWNSGHLISQLFQVFARDWLDAKYKVAVDGRKGAALCLSKPAVAGALFIAADLAALHVGRGNSDVRKVIGEGSSRIVKLLTNDVVSSITASVEGVVRYYKSAAGLKYEALHPAVVAMVHSYGQYRKKVFFLFSEFRAIEKKLRGNANSGGQLADSFMLGASDVLRALPDEESFRAAFEGGFARNGVRRVLAMVPEIAELLLEKSIEDVIDYEPLKLELSLPYRL